jgi:hypothetical protein
MFINITPSCLQICADSTFFNYDSASIIGKAFRFSFLKKSVKIIINSRCLSVNYVGIIQKKKTKKQKEELTGWFGMFILNV